MKEQAEEEFFKKIMSKSNFEMPFSNFEEEVMMQIKKQEVYQKTDTRNLTLSWLFFVAGSVFGLILSFLMPEVLSQIVKVNPNVLAQALQVIIVLWILIQLESLIEFTRGISFVRRDKIEMKGQQK